ncbi:MAG: hypothetical protein LQ343_000921 [Gyalolechia ehrenbergii]|nr:MAG: hypothetical protein LQ343_000921 [Gyalolechia ehrenbergii]
MAGLIDWIFPCFGIGSSQGPGGSTQRGTKELPEAGLGEDSHRPNNTPYRPTVAGSMHYLSHPLTLKADNRSGVTDSPRQGTFDAKKPGLAYEMKAIKQHQAPGPLSQARAKTGRPELTVCIPASNSKPPVLKSHPSPDSALDEQQALAAATPVDKPERSKGERASRTAPKSTTPVETPNASASVRVASNQHSAQTNPSETPAYTRWVRAQADQTAVQQPKNANLKDELDSFSIASREEELSAYDEQPSARSAKPVSALRSSEVKISAHDFAHEEHRDLAARLTPNTLHLARRIAEQVGASTEQSKDELKMNAGRRLC